jgi:hypothetical protein
MSKAKSINISKGFGHIKIFINIKKHVARIIARDISFKPPLKERFLKYLNKITP